MIDQKYVLHHIYVNENWRIDIKLNRSLIIYTILYVATAAPRSLGHYADKSGLNRPRRVPTAFLVAESPEEARTATPAKSGTQPIIDC